MLAGRTTSECEAYRLILLSRATGASESICIKRVSCGAICTKRAEFDQPIIVFAACKDQLALRQLGEHLERLPELCVGGLLLRTDIEHREEWVRRVEAVNESREDGLRCNSEVLQSFSER